MPSRAQREAVVRREREILARGPMTEDEQVEFQCKQAWATHELELKKYPERFAPELPLETPHA